MVGGTEGCDGAEIVYVYMCGRVGEVNVEIACVWEK